MILTCERCDTRFRLDESRLPAKGARVRCSRCKHAFFVRPPGASPAAAIEELAADATRTGRPGKPDVAWDLDESADLGSTIQQPRAPAAEAAAESEDESDWRFEDEVPQLGDSGASLDLPNGEAPALSAEPDPNGSSFAQLGDPESWDLLATSSGDIAGTKAIGGLQAPPRAAERPVAPREVEAAPRPVVAVEPERPVAATLPNVALASPRSVTAGWAATVALAALVLAGVIRATPARVAEPAALAFGPLALEKVHARLVDNVFAGPVWVVSGEIHNATSEPKRLDSAVGVVLLDRSGEPIRGAVAIAQPALPPVRVQEDDPLVLHDQASSAAAGLSDRAIAPDARVAFDAVFGSAPRDAVRFAIERQPLPKSPTPHVVPVPAPEAELAPPPT